MSEVDIAIDTINNTLTAIGGLAFLAVIAFIVLCSCWDGILYILEKTDT